MSVIKYKDPRTGAWIRVPGLKVIHVDSGGGSTDIGAPPDIVAEANRVTASIQGKIAKNAVNFIAISDMHEMGDGDHHDATIIERYRRANRNAGQGARLVAEKIKADFFANLGDLAWGSSATTAHDLTQSITSARSYTAGIESLAECFYTPGNHDVDHVDGYLSADVLAGMIGTYRYMDLAAKKVRVICLNTADNTDGTNSTERISGEQLQWFASALDLSGKSDADQWSVMVLSHHPLDWGNIKPAANCVAAYISGTVYSVTHDGISVFYDYRGKNAATFIANFHGHTHCFKVGNISGTEALRVAIPNACYGRNNEYGAAGNTEFGEIATYNKSDDSTGKNTAFSVVSVDLDEKVIYADCFGAGYDRVISYGGEVIVTYSVTSNLSVATSSNSASVVTEGSVYAATISVPAGYALDRVLVTMGGEDITATAVMGRNIHIAKVTGNIVITVLTNLVEDFEYGVFTNKVLTSEERDSTNIYNTIGYKNNTYPSETTDGVQSGIVCTGWIPYTWTPENVLYIKGATLDTSNNYVRIFGFDNKTHVNSNVGYTNGSRITERFTVETLGDKYYKLTPKTTATGGLTHIRVSLVGVGDHLIVTVNEPIHAEGGEAGTYSVTNHLTNVDNGNPAASVTSGASYNAALTAADGYIISAVTVTMGGADITSTVYSGGVIRIASVTGDVVIMAVATVNHAVGYTNLVPTSVDTDGTVYNGKGYKEGYRFKSDGSIAEQAGAVHSGFIAYDGEVIRIYGATRNEVGYSGNYLVMYDVNLNKITQYGFNNLVDYGAVWTSYNGKYMLTIDLASFRNPTAEENIRAAAYIRCGFGVCTGENFVVTLNEPIE